MSVEHLWKLVSGCSDMSFFRVSVLIRKKKMIKVIILDVDSFAREGVKSFLSSCDDINIINEDTDPESLADVCKQNNVDVVIMEIMEADQCSIDLIRKLRDSISSIKILILTHCSERDFAMRAIRAGALGFVQKDCSPQDLASAVRKVAEGRPYLSENFCEMLVTHIVMANIPNADGALSEIETEILHLLIDGKTTNMIAEVIGITPAQVRSKKLKIMKKLGANSIADLRRNVLDLNSAH